jgi:hypothetical protein
MTTSTCSKRALLLSMRVIVIFIHSLTKSKSTLPTFGGKLFGTMPMILRNRSMQQHLHRRSSLYKRHSVSASGVPELIPSSGCCYFPQTTRCLLWASGLVGTALLLSIFYDGGFFINDMLRRDLGGRGRGMIDNSATFAAAAASIDASSALALASPGVEAATVPQSRQASCRLMRNHVDVDHCYPLGSVKKFSDAACAVIDTWAAVQRCLFGRYEYDDDVNDRPGVGSAVHHKNQTSSRSNANDISVVHIVGERHSGTKFITEQVQDCFPKTVGGDDENGGFKIHRDFLRSKHFFQPIFPTEDYRRRLILVVVRDPYEWVAAMRERPYHAPNHVQALHGHNKTVVPLPWQKFVARRWTTQRSVEDEAVWRTADRETLQQYLCRERFRLNQVRPCRLDNVTAQYPPWNIPLRFWRGFEPMYEHNGRDGQPYQTLLDLRRDKLINWILQIPLVLRVGAFLVVRYEDVLERGTGFLMDQIAAMTGRPKSDRCRPAPPQPDRLGRRNIPDDFRKWIRENLHSETERLVGYV